MKIVKYHYVRDFNDEKSKNLKGLDFNQFDFQLRYLKSNFNVLEPAQAHEKILNLDFNPNDCWLTFDDGYSDHFKFVYPKLTKYDIRATFFPTIAPFYSRKLLDVNKIHYILASNNDYQFTYERIKFYYQKYQSKLKKSFTTKDAESDLSNILKGLKSIHRWDNEEVIKIKRLLQYAIPNTIRHYICEKLFNEFVNFTEEELADSLYMSIENLIDLKENGHEIGIHGIDHLRWGTLNSKDQEKEIINSYNFLKTRNLLDSSFSCCYPWGSYNNLTIKILKQIGCKLALTSSLGEFTNTNKNFIFELPRFDTNDFPQSNLKEEDVFEPIIQNIQNI